MASSTVEDGEEPKSIIHINQNNPVWQSTMSNGTAYVHVLLVRQTPAFISSSHVLLLLVFNSFTHIKPEYVH
jgi:hypothetical protein